MGYSFRDFNVRNTTVRQYVIWTHNSTVKISWKQTNLQKDTNKPTNVSRMQRKIPPKLPGYNKCRTYSTPLVATGEDRSDLCKAYPIIREIYTHELQVWGGPLQRPPN